MTSTTDGRDTRWQAHRLSRREELIDATLRAVRSQGAGLTVDDIAAAAGTSKTVLYRYFGDRAGLYGAVVERVARNVVAGLQPAMRTSHASLEALVRAVADSYSKLVERDPEIYTFVRNRPGDVGDGDPVASVTGTIAESLAEALRTTEALPDEAGRQARLAAHGMVGYVRATVDFWFADGCELNRVELVDGIAEVFGSTHPAPARPERVAVAAGAPSSTT